MTYRNISVKELAAKTDLSESTIRTYIRGSRTCRFTSQERSIDALHVTAGYLHGEYPMMDPETVKVANHIIQGVTDSRPLEVIEKEIMEEAKQLDRADILRLAEYVGSFLNKE